MARKTFTQAKENLNTQQNNGDFINSFYLKHDKESNFVKFLKTDIEDMDILSVHNVALISPRTGKKYFQLVDCHGDGCPLCKASQSNTAIGKVRDMIFIPLIQLYTADGQFEPTYKVFNRSVRWASDVLAGFTARYGLDGIIELERNGSGMKTTYAMYEARKGWNGEELPNLPDIDKMKEDFNVQDDDIIGKPTSLVHTWTAEMVDLFNETGSPYVPKTEEKEDTTPRRRGF